MARHPKSLFFLFCLLCSESGFKFTPRMLTMMIMIKITITFSFHKNRKFTPQATVTTQRNNIQYIVGITIKTIFFN